MKKLFGLLVLALLFVGFQDVGAETINACVNKNNGNTRILAPNSNSEECRNSENPVNLSQNGGGNGNIMTITESIEYSIRCGPGGTTYALVQIECPNNKAIIGGFCDVDPEIPETDLPDVPVIGMSAFTNTTVTNQNGPFSNIQQIYICTLNCASGSSDAIDINGTLFGTAVCLEP